MQLEKIKLAGFKSFVDPTTVYLPGNLTAIVGPNGCGKSNIIDAVCWVMGESSAKYLRGESLTDVIFNGSSARKPVGQASVELLFNNQDGAIGGEYASYAEISIRRSISREGDSNYYLNGNRCRRRDIIDIFLGTGLGPRSYSIIGQNMISRIIEAKPDDMRIYLEEAAGVSKYKERRRETKNRMDHTKENLARLDDVRLELEKQLSSLKRQADAAEKFKTLKQEERVIKAQWYGIQWREYDVCLVQYTLRIQQEETGLESRHAELSGVNLLLEEKREEQHVSAENFQEVQRRYYAVGSEVARVEQDIRHTHDRKQQWQMDLERVEQDWKDVNGHLEEAQLELEELSEELLQLEPDAKRALDVAHIASQEWNQAEENMQAWQTQWDNFNQHVAKVTQTAHVEQAKIQHVEQRIQSLHQRKARLEQEKSQISFSHLDDEITQMNDQFFDVEQQAKEQQEKLAQAKEGISRLQQTQYTSIQHLDQIKNELQQRIGQKASLDALQQVALGKHQKSVTQWLTQHQLDKKPRLAQGIEVKEGWERAVEKVLGADLQAICVDELTDVATTLDSLTEGSLSVFATQTSMLSSDKKANTLASQVISSWPIESLLANIYIAESLSDALTVSQTLAPYESVITRDGIWLGHSWLRVSHDEDPEAGIFHREQELKKLAEKISALTLEKEALERTLLANREELKTLESQRDDFQKTVNRAHAEVADINAQRKVKREKLLDLKNRMERFQQEFDESIEQLEEAEIELTQSRAKWQQAMTELEQHSMQRQALSEKRDTLRDIVQKTREKANQAKEHAHSQEIRLQTTRSQQSSLQQALSRMQSQLSGLQERQMLLKNEEHSGPSIEELEENLSNILKQRLTIEEELNKARQEISTIEQEQRHIEGRRQEIERESAKMRDALEHSRLEYQSLKVKSENLLEQIKENGFIIEDILKELPEDAVATEWHGQLEQIGQRIQRLGAINLVAIEEYSSCLERKEYLDKQYADLAEGLLTLENAIIKIDKETRARFKETFDKVNERFKELFPVIFGGGRAYLELTGDNLLDAGVTLMACPPGKRNSTIHLLSGGEKAMTAIALVFSIFHLNPSPFCLLDEVDAPLDDANIGRFCDLVKKMSDKTQFIFISHNKLAIEMAEHLTGVTMHEPGVSRLVSVTVEEAVSLAGA